MLRMPSKIRTSLLICFLVFGVVSSASGTCADSLVRAYGEIEGEIGPNSKITIEISPNPRRAMPIIPVKKPRFDIQASFDTFIMDIKQGERCGRVPESVTLILLEEDKEVARVPLNIKKDFLRDEKTWNYSLRQSAKINLRSK